MTERQVPTTSILDDPDDPRFADLLAIYRRSIERTEQKSAAQLRAMLLDRRYSFHILALDGEVAGLAIVFVPINQAFWLLEYMAVDESHRSRGLGRLLFESAAEQGGLDAPRGYGIMEVDQPIGEDDRARLAARRIGFYAEAGARIVAGLNYILPLGEHGAPPPMWLMIHDSSNPARLARDSLVHSVTAMYDEVYGCDADDARLAAMLSHLPAKIALVASRS